MRQITKLLLSALVGLLLGVLLIYISGGNSDYLFLMFYVLIIILIIYIATISLLHTYQTVPYYSFMIKFHLSSSSAAAFNNRALGYLRRGDYELALKDLHTAIQMKPNFANAYINRGIVYTLTSQYEQALQDFNHALQLKPRKMNVYLGRGALYETTKRYQEALLDFDRALDLKPRSIVPYIGNAMIYTNLKDYQQALQECERAIMLAPRKALPYLINGGIHLHFDHFHEALQDFEHAITVSSPSAKTTAQYGRITKYQVLGHISCGAAYIMLKEYQSALQHIEQAIEQDPQYPHSYYTRGIAYLWLNNMELARADIEQSWKMNARGTAYGLLLAWLDLCQVKPNQDIQERLEAIGNLDEMDYFARISRGIAQWIQGKDEEALATLQQYIDTEPETAFVYFWSGVVCASLGRNDEAIAMLDHSLEQRRLPPPLLAPLRWLEEKNPSFYQRDALPLLNT